MCKYISFSCSIYSNAPPHPIAIHEIFAEYHHFISTLRTCVFVCVCTQATQTYYSNWILHYTHAHTHSNKPNIYRITCPPPTYNHPSLYWTNIPIMFPRMFLFADGCDALLCRMWNTAAHSPSTILQLLASS